jgi:hypothetical protein
MPISKVDQETLDLDWFAVDRYGNLAHFATGGQGAIPRHEALSVDGLIHTSQLVKLSLFPITIPQVSPSLERRLGTMDGEKKERYLHSFMEFTKRGLFSFDYIHGVGRPQGYSIVARPAKPAHLADCPDNLQSLLQQIVFERLSFASAEKLDAAEVTSLG